MEAKVSKEEDHQTTLTMVNHTSKVVMIQEMALVPAVLIPILNHTSTN